MVANNMCLMPSPNMLSGELVSSVGEQYVLCGEKENAWFELVSSDGEQYVFFGEL